MIADLHDELGFLEVVIESGFSIGLIWLNLLIRAAAWLGLIHVNLVLIAVSQMLEKFEM